MPEPMRDEGTLVNIVADELRDIMDIKVQPDFVRVYVHVKAIPQYTIGHQEKVGSMERLLSQHRGLYLSGNAYKGISVNDCIENSYRLAGDLAG